MIKPTKRIKRKKSNIPKFRKNMNDPYAVIRSTFICATCLTMQDAKKRADYHNNSLSESFLGLPQSTAFWHFPVKMTAYMRKNKRAPTKKEPKSPSFNGRFVGFTYTMEDAKKQTKHVAGAYKPKIYKVTNYAAFPFYVVYLETTSNLSYSAQKKILGIDMSYDAYYYGSHTTLEAAKTEQKKIEIKNKKDSIRGSYVNSRKVVIIKIKNKYELWMFYQTDDDSYRYFKKQIKGKYQTW